MAPNLPKDLLMEPFCIDGALGVFNHKSLQDQGKYQKMWQK